VVCSAPSRIDLAGGTLDIWPLSMLVPGAVTVNLAIELRARAAVVPRRDRRVRIASHDRGQRVALGLPLDPARVPRVLPLLYRLVAAAGPRRGLDLTCLAEAPAGAGLGGSSTLAVAVAAALGRHAGRRLSRERLLRRVMNLEARELGVPTGSQDYLAAIHGGLAAYHHEPDGPRREALAVPADLAERLVLTFTGRPRRSGLSNWDMFRRFIDGERATVKAMEAIAHVAREMAAALRGGDVDEVGRLIGEEGRLRYALAPTVATPGLLDLGRAAIAAGALGVKVCGAGGGGCLVALVREGRAPRVAAALAARRARILPCRIARRGLRDEAGG